MDQPQPATPAARAQILRIEGDLGVVIREASGEVRKAGDVWSVQIKSPDLFKQLTPQHFSDCADRHPEIAHHCAMFIALLAPPKAKAKP